jgi:hypothetical protein
VAEPEITLVTPTANRQVLLPSAYRRVRALAVASWEWVVVDDGAEPSAFLATLRDDRVRYLRVPGGRTLGAKRNLAAEAARGRVIVHLDDDDYYAPHYPARLLGALHGGAGIAKLGTWLAYSVSAGVLGWVDTSRLTGVHWELSAGGVRKVLVGGTSPEEDGERLEEVRIETPEGGWGFSFAYRRETWRECPFPEVDWNEDGRFATEVARRWGLGTVRGDPSLCLHLVHPGAVSASFACRLVRQDLLGRLFPPEAGRLIEAARTLAPRRQPAPR